MRDQTTEQLTRNIVKLILYCNAILLNSWLLFVLWRDPMKRFRNSTSFIIANLALVDIVGAIGGLGSTTTIFMCKNSCLDRHNLFASIHTVGLQGSFVFIALLAFDRFLAISHPYKYNMIFGNIRCYACLCILGWVIGSILSVLVHYLELNTEKGQEFVLYYLYVIDVTVLALITAILYPLNYYNYLRKKRFFRASIHRDHALENLRLAQQLNVSSMISATVLVTSMAPYAITLSYFLRDCLECLYNETYLRFWVNYQAAIAVILFVNPIIYAWRLPLYRRSSIMVAKPLLHLISCKKRSNEFSDTILNSNNNRNKSVSQLTGSTTGINDVHV